MDSNDIDRLRGLQYFVEFVRRPLLARAEAAEKRAEAAEADLQDALSAVDLYQKRAFSAEDRATELEARLTEQEWRPVTEKPERDGDYLVWCPGYAGVEIQTYSTRANRWYPVDYRVGNYPSYWRPLAATPPPPQGENIDDL